MADRTRAEAIERATIEDLQAIVAAIEDFWGGRDMGFLHQALYVHEFGDTALVWRARDGAVLAYLLGFITPADVGYVHVVAVHRAHRGAGLARRLYEEFAALAKARGARALKAITNPANEGSVAFHRALGFSVTEAPGYSVSGEARIVFWRALPAPVPLGDAPGLSN
jgi:ribosomal protein S18 acetylase RimI-like enzyme